MSIVMFIKESKKNRPANVEARDAAVYTSDLAEIKSMFIDMLLWYKKFNQRLDELCKKVDSMNAGLKQTRLDSIRVSMGEAKLKLQDIDVKGSSKL